MKVALQEEGENYQKFAELTDIGHGYHNFKITTRWAGAKDSTGEQKQFECLLDKTGIENFKKLLG